MSENTSLRWFDWPSMLVFFVLMAVVFAQFVTRYVFNDSWAWTEEIARYLLMALVFFGCISVVARAEHIRLEVLRQRVSRQNQRVLQTFSDGVSTFYYLLLAISISLLALETTQNLVSVAIPKALIYAAVAVSLFAVVAIKLTQFGSDAELKKEGDQ